MTKRIRTVLKSLVFYIATTSVFILAGAIRISWYEPFDHLPGLAMAILFSFLLSWLFIKWDGQTLGDIGLSYSRKTSWQRLLTGAGLGWSMVFAQVTILHALGFVQLVREPLSAAQVTGAILLFLFAAAREELVFRGYALRQLAGSWGPRVAQFIIAAVFVIEHVAGGTSWTNAVLGVGAGALLFGIAALKSGGLALPIGIHFAWNSGQWLVGFKTQPGLWKAVTHVDQQSAADTAGLIVFIAGCVLSSILIIFHYQSSSNSASNRLP